MKTKKLLTVFLLSQNPTHQKSQEEQIAELLKELRHVIEKVPNSVSGDEIGNILMCIFYFNTIPMNVHNFKVFLF